MVTAQQDEQQLKYASNAAMASLLNMTILPLIGFIVLLFYYGKTEAETIGRYHVVLGIKINIIAATVLFLVSALMILLGGFNSPWTWVYMISYFSIVHTLFIVIALWALVRSWSGDRLKST